MRLSMIRPYWITPSEICIILQIIRKENPILLLLLLLLLLLDCKINVASADI